MVQPQPGARFGEFVLRREIGRGAMGSVWEAEQPSLGRTVALKVLSASTGLDPVWVQRFKAEAGAAARLSHPGILPVYGIGETDGLHWFVMELVDGEDLARRLAREGRLPPREAARVIRDAARALHHAHEAGVIHRDVKPANLMTRRDGRVTITDFGLAKHVGSGALTTTGLLVGTPYYMSPELLHAKGGQAVGPASDVYGLGASLYELLVGEPPFTAPNPMALLKMIGEKPPRPPSAIDPKVPRDLETIALTCLEKRPEQRYASARDLADDLDRFLEHQPITMRRPGALERARRLLARNRVAAVVAGLAVILLVGSVLFFTNALRAQEQDYEKRIRDLLDRADGLVATGDATTAAKLYQEAEDISEARSLAPEQVAEARAGHDLVRLVENGVIDPEEVRSPAAWRRAPDARLHLVPNPPDARVRAVLLGADGLEEDVPLPPEGGPIRPGLYRIELEAPGRVRTVVNLLAVPGMHATIEVRLPIADESTVGMVAQAGTWRPRRDDEPGSDEVEVVREGGAYLIDEHATTNAEYADFLGAQPEDRRTALTPRSWPQDGGLPALRENAPVLGLTDAQREAYAAWRGLRPATPEELGEAVGPQVVMALARLADARSGLGAAPAGPEGSQTRGGLSGPELLVGNLGVELQDLVAAAARARAEGAGPHPFRVEIRGSGAEGGAKAPLDAGLRLVRELDDRE